MDLLMGRRVCQRVYRKRAVIREEREFVRPRILRSHLSMTLRRIKTNIDYFRGFKMREGFKDEVLASDR